MHFLCMSSSYQGFFFWVARTNAYTHTLTDVQRKWLLCCLSLTALGQCPLFGWRVGVIKWWSGSRGGPWSPLEPLQVQFSRGEQGQEQTAWRRPLHTSALITQTRLNKRRESGVHPSHFICCYLPECADLPTVDCVSAHSFTEQILVGKQTHPIHSCRSLPYCLSVCDRLPQLLPGRRAERWNKRRMEE